MCEETGAPFSGEKARAFFADRIFDLFANEAEDQWQIDINDHMIIRDIDGSVYALARDADHEIHVILALPAAVEARHPFGEVVDNFALALFQAAADFGFFKLVREAHFHGAYRLASSLRASTPPKRYSK